MLKEDDGNGHLAKCRSFYSNQAYPILLANQSQVVNGDNVISCKLQVSVQRGARGAKFDYQRQLRETPRHS